MPQFELLFSTEECAVPPQVGNCKNLNKILSTLLKYVGTWVFLGTNQFRDLEALISEAAEVFNNKITNTLSNCNYMTFILGFEGEKYFFCEEK